MTSQKVISYCLNTSCKKELQAKVPFCPFCGQSQVAVPVQQVNPSVKSHVASKPVSPPISPVVATPPVSTTPPSMTQGLVEHVTKQGKHLQGIIIESITQDEAKIYDRYAFKKFNGMFIRLEHLSKVPAYLLNKEQLLLQQKTLHQIINPVSVPNDQEKSQSKAQEIKQQEVKKEQTIAPAQSEQPPPIPDSQDVPTIEWPPQQPSAKKRGHKFIVIAFLIILGVVYWVLKKDAPSTIASPQTEAQGVQADEATAKAVDCKVPSEQVEQALAVHQPTRALNIVQMYRDECKQDKAFTLLNIQAESEQKLAQAKFDLAKDLFQRDNLELAHSTAKEALAIDTSLVGVEELMKEINMAQQNLEQAATSQVVSPVPQVAPAVIAPPPTAIIRDSQADVERARLEAQRQQQEEIRRLKEIEQRAKQIGRAHV